MPDDELHRTYIGLTSEQKSLLDELGHSRSGALRRLLTELDHVDYPAESDDDPERCPECGRETLMVVAGSVLDVRGADADAIDYCRRDTAATWLFVHDRV